MWPRFAGSVASAKRKCRVLEFEECTDVASTSTPKRKINDSYYSSSLASVGRRIRAPVIVQGSQCSPGSDFDKTAKNFKPSTVWPRLETQQEREEIIIEDAFECLINGEIETKQEEKQNYSKDDICKKQKAGRDRLGAWSTRGSSSFLISEGRGIRESVIVQKSNTAWPRLDTQQEREETIIESRKKLKVEETPKTTSSKRNYEFKNTLIGDVEIAEDLFECLIDEEVEMKQEEKKSDSKDDICIELSQGNSPRKEIEAEVIEEDSYRDSYSQVPKQLSVESSSNSSLNRPVFFAPRRTITPPSPQKKPRKKLKGLAARVSSHLYEKRGERRVKSITPGIAAIDIRILRTTRCWGVSTSTLDSGQQLFCRRSTVSASGPASSRLALPLAQVQISSGQAPAILHPVFHYPMMTLIVLYITLLLSVIIQVNAIRCQCSTNRGPIPCYNNWCEVNKRDGKEGACAVIQSGNSRTFACVLVRKDSGDECKVDKIDGRMQVRCWCRSSDYCNVDLAERVEEDHEDNNYQIRAEEIATSSPRQLSAVIDPREDFVINAAYEDDLTGVNYDDGDFSLEEDFPHNVYPLPPSLPTTPKPSGGPTIPPWRREVPAASDHELPPLPLPSIPERPDRIPVRPQEQRNRWSERVPERIPERVGERAKGGSEQRRITPEEEEKMRRDEQEKYRREWERAMEEYRRRQNEKRDPWTAPTQSPIPPPPTSRKDSTTTTTTTTKKPEVRKEPERIPERPRYVESTTSTSKRTEKPTTSSTSTTTTTTTKTSSTSSSTTTTTTPRPPSTESLADAFARIKENQEIAKKSYQNHRNRYRVYDFFKTSSTTSTSSSTSTTITSSSTKEPTTIRRTTTALSTTTRKPIEILTTRRRTTTTEKTTTVRVEDDSSPVEEKDILEDISEEKIENISEENEEIEESEEKRPENIHHAGQENKPKVSNLPGLLFALLLIFIF